MLIGIAGRARSGKDTIGAYLVDAYGFQRYAFADKLKNIVNQIHGWGHEHGWGDLKDVVDPQWGFSPRQAYQRFGTEYARGLDENFWIKMAEKDLAANLDSGSGDAVVTDVRFDNEAEWVRKHGVLVHVSRKDAPAVTAHTSEVPIQPNGKDWGITNNNTLEELYNTLEYIMDAIYLKGRA